MTTTVTGLFDDHADAERAVQALESAGVSHGDISVVANDAHGHYTRGGATAGDTETAAGADASAGAGIGAAVGGVGGLLAGLGMLAIPGLGPVVAAGWLASTLVGAAGGAVVGAAAGGLVGALTQAGVPEEDAHVYAEGVRRGGVLVTARVHDDQAAAARSILNTERSVDIANRREAYRSQGWSRFDANAPAFSSEQVAAERARYGQI